MCVHVPVSIITIIQIGSFKPLSFKDATAKFSISLCTRTQEKKKKKVYGLWEKFLVNAFKCFDCTKHNERYIQFSCTQNMFLIEYAVNNIHNLFTGTQTFSDVLEAITEHF